MKIHLPLLALVSAFFSLPVQAAPPSPITVNEGRLKTSDGKDVALWGVNYSVNLSWEYDNYFKPLGIPLTIESLRSIAAEDFAELKELDVRIVRVHLSPSDFTASDGALVDNVFLQALDDLVARCRREGLYVYLSLFNRIGADHLPDSFAARRVGDGKDAGKNKKPYLCDPALLEAFDRYVRALALRVNPLTGVSYADEPTIAIWELMNEPEFMEKEDLAEPGCEGVLADFKQWCADRPAETKDERFALYRREKLAAFLARMHRALRDSGAQQPIFWTYNWPGFMERRRDLEEVVWKSPVDGVSFCLYPGQSTIPYPIDYMNLPDLSEKNLLPMTAPEGMDWSAVRRAREHGKAVAVYEFETWCNATGYLYPAMARLFRQLGAQVACMWEYDPAVAAPRNFVPSHFLNLRATPEKAASFVIAGEVFNHTPLGSTDGIFTESEHRFGASGASFPAATSWHVTDAQLLYSGGLPADIKISGEQTPGFRRILGTGDSPLIRASGNGLYRWEITDDGARLTVWPDVEVIGPLWRSRDWRGPRLRYLDAPRDFELLFAPWNEKPFTVFREGGDDPGQTIAGRRFSVPPGTYRLKPVR